MQYLLDTNIISDLMRDPRGLAAHRVAEVGEKAVCTSIVVAAELRLGAAKRGSQRLMQRVEEALDAIEVLPFDTPADVAYGDLRAAIEARGTPIGSNDMLIAAHGLALGCIVVTDNDDEFRRVPGLIVENWLKSI